MSLPINIVGQRAMDDYLQNYRVSTDFFTLEDFISRAADTVGEYYRQEYEKQYMLIRSEKRDDVVGFSDEVLEKQVLEVKLSDGNRYSTVKNPVFSFPYDQSNIGIQHIFPKIPMSMQEFERTNLSLLYQLKYTPKGSPAIFWWVDGDKIRYWTNGECALKEVTVYYVPSVGNNMMVPDAIVKWVIDNTVIAMRQKATGIVIKESSDQNANKTIETEVDKLQLK